MKQAVAHFPKGKTSTPTLVLSYFLVVLIIVMVVSQLMTIEKLLPIMESYQLPGGVPAAKTVVFLLATCGIFSLPFLLRMNLSPLFRIFSALLLNIYAIIWIKLGIWITISAPLLVGTGMFGSFFKTIPANVVLPFGVLLFICTLLVTWLLRNDLKFKR